MPDEGVDIRVRTTGTRPAARDTDKLGRSIGGLGSRSRRSAGDLRLFSRATTSATGGLRLMTGVAATGGLALAGGLLVGIKRTTDAWQESRKVTAQTQAVLHATRGVANVTAKDVGDLASAISRKTGVDDEAIQSGENLLLTFKKIRNETGAGNDVFDRATKAAVDLSASGFGAITATSKQLGKALNDPLKGITALGRAGVTFTEGQKDQIEALVETGDLLSAQKIILREVESQVGGSAAKQATALDRVKVSWGNIEESIGKGISPAVDAVADDFDHFFVKAEPQISALGDRLGDLFRRKDIGIEDKLGLAGKDIRTTMQPALTEIEREFRSLHVGERLSEAIETGAPIVANAAGRAAGKAATAFAKGWWDMNPAGKLFTAALLGSKLGVFSSLGSLAWGRFRKQWGKGGLPVPVPGGGTTVAPVPTGNPIGKGSRLSRLGKLAKGAVSGVGMLGSAVGGAFVGSTLSDTLHEPTDWMKSEAARRNGGPRTSAPVRMSKTEITVPVNIDGREVARSVATVARDEKARGR
jgi:hypothetical protein